MYSNSDGRCEFLLHVHVGIGIDDMFILISAWRYTSTKLSVEERIGQTLQSAAVSITITSVTDGLAFGIGELTMTSYSIDKLEQCVSGFVFVVAGCTTPFRAVTIFCAYTGAAVVFVYLYMITFGVACMTYSGRREKQNKHPFTCKEVPPKSQCSESALLHY